MILQADSVHGVSVCHSIPQFQNLQPNNLDQISSWYEVGVFFFCPPISWGSSPHHHLTSRLGLLVTGHPCGISSFMFAEIQGGGTPWKKRLRICWKEGSRKQMFLFIFIYFSLTSGSFARSNHAQFMTICSKRTRAMLRHYLTTWQQAPKPTTPMAQLMQDSYRCHGWGRCS